MNTYIELHKERSFSDKLSASIDFLRLNAKPLLKSCLVIAGPALLIGALIAGDSYQTMFTTFPMFNQDETLAMETFSRLGFGFVFGILITMLGAILMVMAVYEYVKLYDEKRSNDISVAEVWERVKKSLPGFLWLLILYVGILFLIWVGIVLTLSLLAAATPVLAFIVAIPAFGLIIYALVNFSLVCIVKTMEKVPAFETFSRSAALVKGKWWSTFGIIFISMMIASVINYMISMIWSVVLMAGVLHEMEATEPSFLVRAGTYISTVISLVVSQFLQILPMLAIAFQYFNLVERKEARGLLNKIETFGQTEVAGNDEEHY